MVQILSHMFQSTFSIPQMDCPTEEQLITLKLEGKNGIQRLDFSLENRKLKVYHAYPNQNIILLELETLGMGTTLTETVPYNLQPALQTERSERKILWLVLIINFAFFLIEVITGLVSESMGLVADSLDMLADAFVYALALMAVGAAVIVKKRVARISGVFQLILAFLGFLEVLRRFLYFGAIPDFKTMVIISFLALIANVICLLILQKTKSSDAHIQASIIFTSNDVVINLGVIAAALLVWFFNSALPDLIVGSIVFLIVIRGAIRILKLSK